MSVERIKQSCYPLFNKGARRVCFLSLFVWDSLSSFGSQSVTLTLHSEKIISTTAYVFCEGAGNLPIDSVQLVDGNATKCFLLDQCEVYRIVVNDLRFGRYIIPEEGKIYVDLDSGKLEGTLLNESYSAFSQKVDASKSTEEYMQLMQETMLQHPHDPIGAIAFYDYLLFANHDSIAYWAEKLSDCVCHSKMVEQQLNLLSLQDETAVGDLYKDFTLITTNTEVMLSSYVTNNKITVVDFWASWCYPCLYSFSYLNDIYAKYHDKGVEIIGVAVQDSLEKTHAAIQKYKVFYPQYFSTRNFASELYGAQGVPFIIVINQDGKILGRNVRADQLEELVKKVL